MSEIQTVLAMSLTLFGLVLMFTGSLGILRLPDFYCRSHASGKTDTLGIVVLLSGLAVYEGLTLTAAKLVVGTVFIGLTNPVLAHAMARAAMKFGLRPWFPKKPEGRGQGEAR
jgi:multicomponent Na+:H+ antiporter subunit G